MIQIIGVPQAIAAMRDYALRARGGEIIVGSESPYAARIELGFHGYDSRGRFYNQEPKPWLLPAFLGVSPAVGPMILAQLMTGGSAMDGLRDGANEMADLSRELVPVLTGDLRSSIEVEEV